VSEDEKKSAKGDSEKESKGGKKSGGKKDKPPKPPSKKTFIIAGVVTTVILIGVLIYWLHARNFESTDDAYTTAHVHDISARVAGTVESIKIDDNQFVREGDTLLVLDQRDFKVAVEQARAQVVQKRGAVAEAEANLTKAQQDYERFSKLAKDQVVAKQDLDNATAALRAANGTVIAAKADLATAQAALDNAELQLSYTKVIAPADGVIAKRTIETGARLQTGQVVMAVVERSVWVLGNFKETQLARMRIGQHVDVRIDAVPSHHFSAHIDSLQPGTGSNFALLPPDNATGNFTKIVQRVPVKIVFDDHALDGFVDRVVPGLSCIPKIDLRTTPR
jgi:membrane fusion protein (multidrug efflux system)